MNFMAPGETAEKFPVVLLYDHLSSVGLATPTYTHLMHELENEYKPELKVWRMDIAMEPEFSAEVKTDIAAAEVIIVAVQADEPLPEAFQHWRDGGAQDAAPHAIIVLLEGKEGVPQAATGSWNRVLRSSATQIHPEVFVCDDEIKPDDHDLVSASAEYAAHC